MVQRGADEGDGTVGLSLEGEPYRTIAALELFGTLLSVIAFSGDWPEAARGRIKLSGSTDNLGNAWVLNRLMSTKFPMFVILGELAVQLRALNMDLSLDWVPRLQNEEADALTNQDFSSFQQKNRVEIKLDEMPWKILPKLAKLAEDLYAEVSQRRNAPEVPERRPAGQGAVRKLRERDPWT